MVRVRVMLRWGMRGNVDVGGTSPSKVALDDHRPKAMSFSMVPLIREIYNVS